MARSSGEVLHQILKTKPGTDADSLSSKRLSAGGQQYTIRLNDISLAYYAAQQN
jgi:hypothetical protein